MRSMVEGPGTTYPVHARHPSTARFEAVPPLGDSRGGSHTRDALFCLM